MTTEPEPKPYNPGAANQADDATYRRNRNRLSNVRWALGQDPHDPDADESSPWDYVRVIADEAPPSPENPLRRRSGPDAGFPCWKCHGPNYRILESRTEAEILAGGSVDDEVWARQNGRGDPERAPNVYALACPQCDDFIQISERALRTLQAVATRGE